MPEQPSPRAALELRIRHLQRRAADLERRPLMEQAGEARALLSATLLILYDLAALVELRK